MNKYFAVMAAVTLLFGCTMATVQRPMPKFAYKQYPATPLNVATINVQENYHMPMQSPNVEHLMPLPLPQAVADWARARFKAVGTSGTMTITISQAAMSKKDLPKTDGVKGWFTVDQSERYDARVLVEFRVDDAQQSGSGVVNLTRGQTVAENASIEEHDRIWNDISEQLMTDLDASSQKLLQERLPFVLK